jgi:hypothetical protein
MYPSEFVVLLAFVCLPAYAAAAFSVMLYWRRGRAKPVSGAPHLARAVAGLVALGVIGFLLSGLIIVLSPEGLGRYLGVHDVRLFGTSIPVFPAAYICYAFTALVTIAVIRRPLG